jgi:DNA-binding CsgD family transcriptional regulator
MQPGRKALATSPPSEDAIVARFLLMGHHCVIVRGTPAPGTGRTKLGSLTIGEWKFEIHGTVEPSAAGDPVERLTPREFEIAMLIATGCCSKTIGRRLGISAHTVGAHVGRIFAKLDVHKRTELMARMAHCLVLQSWRDVDSAPANEDGSSLGRTIK